MTSGKILYDSFNARYLSFQQVADSFIKNGHFDELKKNNHSLLMGPRGCGKTTLLKMLTPAALKFWDEKQKTNWFTELPFFSVYIPTDIQWKKQLDQLTKDLGQKEDTRLISRATVNINILISVIKTFSFLINENCESLNTNNESTEGKLCRLLIDLWKIPKPISPTFDAIELNLISKISELNSEIRKSKIYADYKIKIEEIYTYNYFDLVLMGCTAFEQVCKNIEKKRWALCFDELEIAPEWLQLELLGFLRSREQKILFKLTTAPIVSLYRELTDDSSTINASEQHDFSIVKVWTSNQNEFKVWADFSNQLIKSRISRKFRQAISPDEIFGNSQLERLIVDMFTNVKVNEDKSSFEKDTASWHVFKDLAKRDPTFYDFLSGKKIDPSNPVPLNLHQKDQVFRKVKQLVVYRYQFKRENTNPNKRSRKVLPIYFGLPLIYDLCDGNPRILIGMIDELLELAITSNGGYRKLNINEQARTITHISEKYLSVISSHPDANAVFQNKVINVCDILVQIGEFFHDKFLKEPFRMDPVGSFRVDEDINNKFVELIELALFLGAIVYLDDKEPLSTKGIIGKRFRLSYILAPYFRLLCRDYKDIKLSKILGKIPEANYQQSLFSNET